VATTVVFYRDVVEGGLMTEAKLEPDVRAAIAQQIASAEVVLYMKGSPKMPQCGFSAKTAGLLDTLLAGDYQAYNVLDDERIREGIKAFSDWPTIPQLYIKGEFVGGCDIITEMYNAGELHEMLGLEVPDRTPPEITITDAAAEQINAFLGQYPGQSRLGRAVRSRPTRGARDCQRSGGHDRVDGSGHRAARPRRDHRLGGVDARLGPKT
jgi:Grx4 family monothiol glutaredoxin